MEDGFNEDEIKRAGRSQLKRQLKLLEDGDTLKGKQGYKQRKTKGISNID
jgi:hypothetical protein